jgi:hypothetical protein
MIIIIGISGCQDAEGLPTAIITTTTIIIIIIGTSGYRNDEGLPTSIIITITTTTTTTTIIIIIVIGPSATGMKWGCEHPSSAH